jgi:phosphate butyryltransferase
MSLPGFDDLYEQASAGEPLGVVAAGGADRTVLEALEVARSLGWIKPIVTGVAAEIESVARDFGVDLSAFSVIDSRQPAVDAVSEVRAGRAQLMMKGQIATPELMKAVLHPELGLRTGKTICQTVLMEVPRDDRRFLLTDTGITVKPTIEQKAELVDHVVEVSTALGVVNPAVALMAATEKATDLMPDTLDATELTKRAEAGRFGEARVAGPLSFDLAYAADAGEKKRIAGDVVGAADAMVFPDLLSANLTVKAIMYTADCRFGGVLRGTTHPVVFMSRADKTETRLNSLAFAIRAARSA